MKTITEMKREISQKYESVPERQVSPGIYIHNIGRKYITLLNTWEYTRFERILIEDFYNDRF